MESNCNICQSTVNLAKCSDCVCTICQKCLLEMLLRGIPKWNDDNRNAILECPNCRRPLCLDLDNERMALTVPNKMINIPLLGERPERKSFQQYIPFDGNFQSLIDNGTLIWKDYSEYKYYH